MSRKNVCVCIQFHVTARFNLMCRMLKPAPDQEINQKNQHLYQLVHTASAGALLTDFVAYASAEILKYDSTIPQPFENFQS